MTNKYIGEYTESTSPSATDKVLLDIGSGLYKYAQLSKLLSKINFTTSGKIETTSTASDSIKTAGGGYIAKNLLVGETLEVTTIALASGASVNSIVTTVGATGSDTSIPTEKAVRDSIFTSATSISAGNGMSFTTITGTGSVTMGTPSDITPNSTNETTSTSHSHEITGGTLCRAWVNFNGAGTVAIRASFNVSSITDNNTGNYTINFTNAMPDANYSEIVGSGIASAPTAGYARAFCTGSRLSTSIAVLVADNGGDSNHDMEVVNVSIFR